MAFLPLCTNCANYNKPKVVRNEDGSFSDKESYCSEKHRVGKKKHLTLKLFCRSYKIKKHK